MYEFILLFEDKDGWIGYDVCVGEWGVKLFGG